MTAYDYHAGASLFDPARYSQESPFKIHGGCGLMGICDQSGTLMSGENAIKAMAVQRDRGNGLGGGFAGYGIYPDPKSLRAPNEREFRFDISKIAEFIDRCTENFPPHRQALADLEAKA